MPSIKQEFDDAILEYADRPHSLRIVLVELVARWLEKQEFDLEDWGPVFAEHWREAMQNSLK